MKFQLTACESPFIICNEPAVDTLRFGNNSWSTADRFKSVIYHKKEYVVGCGKCNICKHERAERKRNKWHQRLAGMIKEFQSEGVCTWNRGKPRRAKGRVFFMTLTVSNSRYPGAVTWDGSRIPNYLIKRLNRSVEFRRESYTSLKLWLQKILKNANLGRKNIKYVFFPEWGSKPDGTNRLHLHVFWFVHGHEGPEFCRWFLNEWRALTLTTEGNYRAVTDDWVAAFYASKYASKVPAMHRVMSSQFNWVEYEKKFTLDYHGLLSEFEDAETESGYKKWVVKGGARYWLAIVEEVDVGVLENPEKDLGVALSEYMEGLSVIGAMVLDSPAESIFKGGYIRCVGKNDYTLKRTMQNTQPLLRGQSLLIIPQSPTWVSCVQRSRVLAVINQVYPLPQKILEEVYDLFTPSLCGLALLYKVSAAIMKRYRTRFTPSTVPHQI